MPLPRVWIVEDNAVYRGAVARALNATAELNCEAQFGTGKAILTALEGGNAPDVLLLDAGLPDGSGIDLLPTLCDQAPDCHILMLTVFEDAAKITLAICNGAQGYLLKNSPIEEIITGIQQALKGGVPMTPSIAHQVLHLFSKFAPKQSDYGLSVRERETLELMVQGFIRKEIADRLNLSLHTVDTYLRGVYRKLAVNTRTGAVAKALKEGLV
ncbi:MAG: response regulator [Verrucomicrobium sp.]|nr:response regulator transcription factor [Verrucomicrobium sp.]